MVKFCKTYSRALHELLASQDPPLAPQLYGYEEIPGGWKVVVMEHVDDVKPWDNDATDAHCEALDRALAVMKKNGFMHGDLRAPNVLIRGDSEVFIIDFEFSGDEDVVRLPYNIAATEFAQIGAKGLGVITHEMDEAMALLLKKFKEFREKKKN